MFRHPEALARVLRVRASKGDGPGGADILRGSRHRSGDRCRSHLRM